MVQLQEHIRVNVFFLSIIEILVCILWPLSALAHGSCSFCRDLVTLGSGINEI